MSLSGKFDESCDGPSISEIIPKCIPICSITQIAKIVGHNAERQQLPLTIHKSQGLTLDKTRVELGKTENVTELTYVALSRVRALSELVVEPMTLEHLQAPEISPNLSFQINEEKRLNAFSNPNIRYR